MKIESSEFKLIISGHEMKMLRAILANTTGDFLKEIAEKEKLEKKDIIDFVQHCLRFI